MLGGNIGCAMVLAAICVLTLFAMAYLLKTCFDIEGKKAEFLSCFIIASPLIFLSSIFFPYLHMHFYKGSYITQPWHNATYIMMRLFALTAVALFLKIRSHYLESGIRLKEWILFLLSLALANASKPNFFIFFAPAMLVILIYDFIKTKAKKLLVIVEFGIPVLISAPVLLLQFSNVYGEGNSAQNPSKMYFTVSKFIDMVTSVEVLNYIFFSLLFILAVTAVCIIKKSVNQSLIFGWIMFFFAYVEKWFIFETGYRAQHGNFGWGIYAAGLMLTIICVARLLSVRERISERLFNAIACVLIVMVISGLPYFGYIFLGGTGLR